MLEINPENVSEDSAFYLGVNALTYDKTELAYDFLKRRHKVLNRKVIKTMLYFGCG